MKEMLKLALWDFLLNLFFTSIFSSAIAILYKRYGHSLSNRTVLAKNFMLISLTTMLIISLVKSSLPLSLGLIGALSIVRFRTAIKEPEELAYLFICIAIGLGFGAGERVITIFAITFIAVMIYLRRNARLKDLDHSIYLTVYSSDKIIEMKRLTEILDDVCPDFKVCNYDIAGQTSDTSCNIELNNIVDIDKLVLAFKKIDESIKISFLDNRKL